MIVWWRQKNIPAWIWNEIWAREQGDLAINAPMLVPFLCCGDRMQSHACELSNLQANQLIRRAETLLGRYDHVQGGVYDEYCLCLIATK